METRSKWYKWEVLALLTQLKSLGYNGFDMETESETCPQRLSTLRTT